MRPPLERATEACADYLDRHRLGIAAAECFSPEPQRLEPVAQLVAAVDCLRLGVLVPAVSHAEAEAQFTMSFAWRQISSNIKDLAACVGADDPARASRRSRPTARCNELATLATNSRW